MVKVALIDAETPLAGETVRLLINHPETEIISLYSPQNVGHPISSLHAGLIGEPRFIFSDKLNLEEPDLILLFKKSELSRNIISQFPYHENQKLISLFKENFQPGEIKPELGLSELNRKALVRGAQMAYITSPAIVPALIAVAPLASFLLLNSDINIEVKLPADIVETTDIHSLEEEISRLLKIRQASFNGKVNILLSAEKDNERGSLTSISLKNSLPVEEIEKIYEQTYDDHNFAFHSRSRSGSEEVEATQKVLIKIDKPTPETLLLEVSADARMRGGAGDIVHIFNLFFGLHEKTGLALKTSRFFPKKICNL
ncbi:MAG: hypothetical protein J1D77_03760 [Muribaculaceae bacterium]|nr:hypothetical protein [Muribaculaceae bacterium]